MHKIGAGQCTTCAVKVESSAWGPRSEYEAGKLAKKYGANNEEYRLACQTLVQPGAATVTLRPPPPGKK
jgi:ferredoxin